MSQKDEILLIEDDLDDRELFAMALHASGIPAKISRLRRKIEADPKSPRYIKTVWGGGYTFAAEVRRL
jgi:two-component system OmpR family response regulator